ncbi:MAG: tRNA (adenosine(37)-N6)-threonylcarbamoyltransferase complex dimerization subunit type 1 TsaB [Terriglobales bacterium]
MLILGVDTSGRKGSVALARGDAESFEVLEMTDLTGGMYSAQLIPAVTKLLEACASRKSDLDGFAVASGPGSFTGLRVGLSAVKGLAEILGKPIAAISVLEAIAATSDQDGRTIAALDAGRKEVYVGEFEVRGGKLTRVRESLLTQAEFSALLDAQPGAELITPDASISDLAGMHLHLKQIEPPNAGDFARLGVRKILAGEVVATDALEANYIRRSDAEIFSKGGRGN